MFNGSICYVLYLQILHFYLVWQHWLLTPSPFAKNFMNDFVTADISSKCIKNLTLWTRPARMRTNSWCVRNPSGPHTDQYMFGLEKLTYDWSACGPPCKWLCLHYRALKSLFQLFLYVALQVWHYLAKNNSKTDPKWWKLCRKAK